MQLAASNSKSQPAEREREREREREKGRAKGNYLLHESDIRLVKRMIALSFTVYCFGIVVLARSCSWLICPLTDGHYERCTRDDRYKRAFGMYL